MTIGGRSSIDPHRLTSETLRQARTSDLPAIDHLERALFGNPWPSDAYAQELEREFGYVEVLERAGQLLGFSCSWYVAEEAHLMRIGVGLPWQGTGCGRRLLRSVVARAEQRNCTSIILEVAASNVAALRLYRHERFEEIGRRLGYYRTPSDDAIVMRRGLPQPTGEP